MILSSPAFGVFSQFLRVFCKQTHAEKSVQEQAEEEIATPPPKLTVAPESGILSAS